MRAAGYLTLTLTLSLSLSGCPLLSDLCDSRYGLLRAAIVILPVLLHDHCSISYWRASDVCRLQGQAFGAAAGVLGAAAAMRRQQMDRDAAQVIKNANAMVCAMRRTVCKHESRICSCVR